MKVAYQNDDSSAVFTDFSDYKFNGAFSITIKDHYYIWYNGKWERFDDAQSILNIQDEKSR